MNEEVKPVIKSISQARERGVSDEIILTEIKKQNPEKEASFLEAQKRGVGATKILDEIIKQNTKKQEPSSDVSPPPIPPVQNQDNSSSLVEDISKEHLNEMQEKKSSSSLKNKNVIIFIGAGLLFLILIVFFIFYLRAPVNVEVSSEDIEKMELRTTEIANLTESAIVKIGYEVTGNIITPGFVIDVETLEFQRDESVDASAFEVDHYWEGTGFIVGKDGHILTNAHVVTIEEVKTAILLELVTATIYQFLIELQIMGRTEEIQEFQRMWEELDEGSTQEEKIERFKKNEKEIFEEAILSLEKNIKVFNPSSSRDKLPELFNEGFDAELVFANESYRYDQKDVALLKIEENNLPTIKIEKDKQASIGDTVFVFGFPVASSILDVIGARSTSFITVPNISVSGGYTSPSFTGGNITAIKDSLDGTFKLIESDAKVSPGSSGSPVLNEQGSVVGVVSFITGEGILESGDIMMRAVPITILEEFKNDFEEFFSGEYYTSIKRGIYLMKERHCKQAIEEFKKGIEDINDNFSTESINIFINDCQRMIEQGRSVDTRWGVMRK